jgi:type VI secretion system VgrG family protein
MADTLVQLLEFTVDGQAPDTFSVFRMRGREAISELFRFEIEAVSGNEYLDADAIIGEKACLTVGRLQWSRKIYGMVQQFELHDITPQGQYIYQLVLVPRLQLLTLTRQNQIHGTTAEMSVREILNVQLTASDLKGAPAAKVSGRLGLNDFELRLTRSYPKRDYTVQYDESDFAFISRLCEHYGIFYFFAHENDRDSVVFSDSRITFPTIGEPGEIAYRPRSGLTNTQSAGVFRFVSRNSLVPAQVCLRDYNYRMPNLTLEVDELVDTNGHGVVVEYGAHFRTPQEGRDLARIRAQELACRKRVFQGASDSVQLTAGSVFDLNNHFRNDFNASYLVTWIEHEATQATPGIADFTGADHQISYRNRFECQPKTVEYRPARVTPRPKITGLTNAVVDAVGDGLRAEIGPAGRYKIRQQFDQRGEAAGQASRYMRKAEPYGGANTGMHFPLLKGTEVVMACVNGDPDRPIIVGAVQNDQYHSVVNALNNTKNRIRTTSGTVFEIDDGPASSSPGGSGATGVTLAPQRALEGDDAPVSDFDRSITQPLKAQRAEAETQTAISSSSPHARLRVSAGTDSYWRLGAKPTDTIESTRKPGMSDMTGGGAAGAGGLFEYTAGDQCSLIAGSSYAQVGVDRLDYVVGKRRMSAATHNAVSKGQYQVIANGVAIQATTGAITDNSSPANAPAGNIVITASGNFTQNVTGNASATTSGNSITKTNGTKVTETWGSTASFMMGSTVSMTLGSAIGVTLGAKTDITGLLKIDIRLALDIMLRLGFVFDYALAGKTTFVIGPEIKVNSTKVKTTVLADIKAAATKLETAAAVVDQKAVQASVGTVEAKVTAADVTV